MNWTFLFIFPLFIFACAPSTEDTDSTLEQAIPAVPSSPITSKIPDVAELTTSVDNLRLRETPGSDGKELMRLPENSVVMPTGKKTDLKQHISLRGLSYNEAWVEVKVDENNTGWIYGGALDLNPNSSQFAKEIFENRTRRFFGSKNEDLEIYRTTFEKAKTAADLKAVFEKGEMIKHEVAVVFQKRSRVNDMPLDLELRWLAAAFPGYSLAKVAEGTEVAFLLNLNRMIERSESTSQTDDEAAFKFLKKANGGYSLLVSFRDWTEQTTDFGGVSRLGSNKHFQLFEAAQKLFDEKNIFSEGLIRQECNQMLADIVSNEVGYLRGKDAVLAEINKIMDANFSFLSEDQKLSLKNRVKQFDDPETNKIYLNERVGKF